MQDLPPRPRWRLGDVAGGRRTHRGYSSIDGADRGHGLRSLDHAAHGAQL
jgi:hypothetical protein